MRSKIYENFNISTDSGHHRPLNRYPKNCSICHHKISVNAWYEGVNIVNDRGFLTTTGSSNAELVIRCPNCYHLLIATYEFVNGGFQLLSTAPSVAPAVTVYKEIEKISPQFKSIFSQSHKAHNLKMGEIAGCGFRKALEFLIKDYCIYKNMEKEDEIRNMFLGKCIHDLVEEENIKQCAERATWLGNDESHYSRRWEDKDINDLINLLELVMHWIAYEIETKKYLNEMPENK